MSTPVYIPYASELKERRAIDRETKLNEQRAVVTVALLNANEVRGVMVAHVPNTLDPAIVSELTLKGYLIKPSPWSGRVIVEF